MTFTCSCCGEVHDGLADLVFDAPYYYHTVPPEQRQERCLLTSDLCSIDNEDFFIRGCLDIPIIGRPERFMFELEESEHALSQDYRHGITEERLQQIYEANLHAA